MIFAHIVETPIGRLQIITDETAVQVLHFPGSHDETVPSDTEAALPGVMMDAISWLQGYFARERAAIEKVPNLRPMGTPFQQRIWSSLSAIPYGETRTYRSIAAEIEAERGIERMAAQAVGGAVGRNPIPIFIPCHRVIGSDGALTGYRGGLDRKLSLLAYEGVDLTRLKWPNKD